MKIKFLGQSCFLITTKRGTRIVTDPYENSIGLTLPHLDADIVTVSHSHFDHNNTRAVGGDFRLIDRAGDYTCGDISIRGTSTFHDNVEGALRGSNIVFTIEADGLVLCHLGDLGHLPDESVLHVLKGADVLFVPAGEVFTFSVADALKTAKLIGAKVVIPMHYKAGGLTIGLAGIEKFLKAAGGGRRLNTDEIEITQQNLDDYAGIIVMDFYC